MENRIRSTKESQANNFIANAKYSKVIIFAGGLLFLILISFGIAIWKDGSVDSVTPPPSTADGMAQRETIENDDQEREQALQSLQDRVLSAFRKRSRGETDRLLEQALSGDQNRKLDESTNTDPHSTASEETRLIEKLNSIDAAPQCESPTRNLNNPLRRRRNAVRKEKKAPTDMKAFTYEVKPATNLTDDVVTRLIYQDRFPPVKIFEGECLKGVVLNQVICDSEQSPVMVSVVTDYIDSSGRYVLIPAGTRIIGTANKVTNRGASRLAITFSRMILPNQQSVRFPQKKLPRGLDSAGAAGLATKVNRHFWLNYGSTLLVGVLDGVTAWASSRTRETNWAVLVDQLTRQFSEGNRQVAGNNQTVMPTITISAGSRVNVYFAGDLLVSPYKSVQERSYAVQ